jgi:hypothetical protein
VEPKKEERGKKWREAGEDCIMRIFVRWAGYVAPIGQMRNVLKILVGKSEGKRAPRRN